VSVGQICQREVDLADLSARSLMRSGGFRRLPVVDLDRKLVGIVTLDDILMLLAEEFTEVGRLLGRETPRAAAKVF